MIQHHGDGINDITSVENHFEPVVARLFRRLPGVGFSDVRNALIKYTVT